MSHLFWYDASHKPFALPQVWHRNGGTFEREVPPYSRPQQHVRRPPSRHALTQQVQAGEHATANEHPTSCRFDTSRFTCHSYIAVSFVCAVTKIVVGQNNLRFSASEHRRASARLICCLRQPDAAGCACRSEIPSACVSN